MGIRTWRVDGLEVRARRRKSGVAQGRLRLLPESPPARPCLLLYGRTMASRVRIPDEIGGVVDMCWTYRGARGRAGVMFGFVILECRCVCSKS